MVSSGSQRDLAILKASLDALSQEDRPVSENLDRLFDISLARRLAAITVTLLPQLGDRVVAGPFAGMTYAPDMPRDASFPSFSVVTSKSYTLRSRSSARDAPTRCSISAVRKVIMRWVWPECFPM